MYFVLFYFMFSDEVIKRLVNLQLIHVTRERKPQHVIRVFK